MSPLTPFKVSDSQDRAFQFDKKDNKFLKENPLQVSFTDFLHLNPKVTNIVEGKTSIGNSTSTFLDFVNTQNHNSISTN